MLSESAILRVTLGARRPCARGRWIPIKLVEGLPRPDPSNASARLVSQLSREDFPGHHFTIGPTGRF